MFPRPRPHPFPGLRLRHDAWGSNPGAESQRPRGQASPPLLVTMILSPLSLTATAYVMPPPCHCLCEASYDIGMFPPRYYYGLCTNHDLGKMELLKNTHTSTLEYIHTSTDTFHIPTNKDQHDKRSPSLVTDINEEKCSFGSLGNQLRHSCQRLAWGSDVKMVCLTLPPAQHFDEICRNPRCRSR